MKDSELPKGSSTSSAAKLKAKKFNKRLDLMVGFFHAGALAVLGLGGLRYIFDVDRDAIDYSAILLAFALAAGLELLAMYLVRFMRSED